MYLAFARDSSEAYCFLSFLRDAFESASRCIDQPSRRSICMCQRTLPRMQSVRKHANRFFSAGVNVWPPWLARAKLRSQLPKFDDRKVVHVIIFRGLVVRIRGRSMGFPTDFFTYIRCRKPC